MTLATLLITNLRSTIVGCCCCCCLVPILVLWGVWSSTHCAKARASVQRLANKISEALISTGVMPGKAEVHGNVPHDDHTRFVLGERVAHLDPFDELVGITLDLGIAGDTVQRWWSRVLQVAM